MNKLNTSPIGKRVINDSKVLRKIDAKNNGSIISNPKLPYSYGRIHYASNLRNRLKPYKNLDRKGYPETKYRKRSKSNGLNQWDYICLVNDNKANEREINEIKDKIEKVRKYRYDILVQIQQRKKIVGEKKQQEQINDSNYLKSLPLKEGMHNKNLTRTQIQFDQLEKWKRIKRNQLVKEKEQYNDQALKSKAAEELENNIIKNVIRNKEIDVQKANRTKVNWRNIRNVENKSLALE